MHLRSLLMSLTHPNKVIHDIVMGAMCAYDLNGCYRLE